MQQEYKVEQRKEIDWNKNPEGRKLIRMFNQFSNNISNS